MAPIQTVSLDSITESELLQVIALKRVICIESRSGGHNAILSKLNAIFEEHKEKVECLNLKAFKDSTNLEKFVLQFAQRKTLPLVFVKGDCVGSADDVVTLSERGDCLKNWLSTHDYDLIVMGGGSGGLAAAKEAGKLGKKVACLDFVSPTPVGTSWGLGGTCVNVGCIPKKLMHQASLLGKSVEDAKKLGWKLGEKSHDWKTMTKFIQDYIGSLNWGYRVALRENSVTYLNAAGSFSSSHSIKAKNKAGKIQTLTSDRFILATGLRPRYLDVPGAKEFCITSDDLFSLPYNPGKTLLVGASYVSLECAGFLKGIGLDVTVMVRSILLRGFDQQMANKVGDHMRLVDGVTFITGTVPTKIEQLQAGKPGLIRVTAKAVEGSGEDIVGEYNTVILAIGRDATTDELGLGMPAVKCNPKNKKIIGIAEQSSVPYIYAIGDILDDKPELTPVAIEAGIRLARRMFGASAEHTDYVNIPTTVFTPLEYGCCGVTEEAALEQYGESEISVYHTSFKPLEIQHREDSNHCYAKLICLKPDLKVIGLHIVSPSAGEVTQGFAIAFRFGATKADFDRLIGIHPTIAEVFTTLQTTKAESIDVTAGGC